MSTSRSYILFSKYHFPANKQSELLGKRNDCWIDKSFFYLKKKKANFKDEVRKVQDEPEYPTVLERN